MLKEYPSYKRGEIEDIYRNLPQSERAIIQDYLNYRRIGSKSENKIKDYKRFITQLRHISNKKFENIELQDLRDYLTLLNQSDREEKGKNDVKSAIKNFLRWKFRDWSVRFDELRDLKVNVRSKFNAKKINSKVLITKEEMEKIIDEEPNLFWKTYFIMLYESGCRPIELRLLRWKDITFDVDGDISEVNVYSTKTKEARVTYVQQSTNYLKTLRDVGQKSEFIFVSPKTNKPIRKEAVINRLNRLSQKILGRKVTPYVFRHSRATELYKLAKENIISKDCAQMFLGHGKDMSEVYTHLNKDQIKEIITKQIFNVKKLSPEKKDEMQKQIDKLTEDLNQYKEYAEGTKKNFDIIKENNEKMKEAYDYLLKLIKKERIKIKN